MKMTLGLRKGVRASNRAMSPAWEGAHESHGPSEWPQVLPARCAHTEVAGVQGGLGLGERAAPALGGPLPPVAQVRPLIFMSEKQYITAR